MTFLQDYKWVILFYSAILLLVFIFRGKFDVQHKFLAMYRTKIGLGLMDRLGTKHSETIKLLGYIGIGAGYVGLFMILYYMIKNLFTLIMIPTATSAVSLVIPGVKIPGSPVTIPLITGWIALFLVIVVHEFSHGVVARAHKIKVNSSGIFFMGPLMGAFVEPDEKELRKQQDTTQYSIYAAGPFSNMLLALSCILLLTYAFTPALNAMENQVGVELVGVTDGYSAAASGLASGMVITAVNSVSVVNFEQFTNEVKRLRPDETVSLTANGTVYSIVTNASPSDPKQGYLGVMTSNRAKTELKNDSIYFKILSIILKWFAELVGVTGLLSLGIGLANLLPLGPVDGGRMLQVTLQKIKGKEKGDNLWKRISVATLMLMAINLFWPALRWILNLLGGIFK